jgi:hypothetical protein
MSADDVHDFNRRRKTCTLCGASWLDVCTHDHPRSQTVFVPSTGKYRCRACRNRYANERSGKLRSELQETRLDAIAIVDNANLSRYPDGFLRPPYPREVAALNLPCLLGVVFTRTTEGFVIRFGFNSFADLVCLYDGEAPWEPGEVADCLGCTLRDLGVLRAVNGRRPTAP